MRRCFVHMILTTQRPISNALYKPFCRNEITPSCRANLFDDRMIGRRMKNVVVAQIQRYVSHSFYAGIIISAGVCEEHYVASFQIAVGNCFALQYLSSGIQIKKYARSVIEYVLH